MTGYWNPFDLMTVRDAAIADIVPSMSDFEGVQFADGRLPYNLGHAAFEFIESKWGKEGLRQFLFALAQERHRRRRQRLRGSVQAQARGVRRAVRQVPEGPVQAVPRQGAAGRLRQATSRRSASKTPYVSVVSIEPSPSGDLMAVAAGNRKDQELDIVLLSTKDGKVIRNLTSGFNQSHGFEYIATPGGFRNNAVPWMSWAPAGDRIAYFARTEKQKTLDPPERRHHEDRAADRAEDGRHAGVARHQPRRQARWRSPALSQRHRRHLHRQPRHRARSRTSPTTSSATTRRPTPPTASRSSTCRGSAATTSCSAGTSPTNKKTQITFGTHDDGGAQFVDADTIVFPSTATDPNQPLDPEVAQERQHLQHLDAEPEDRRAASVHRRARPATSRRSCCATRSRRADRLRHLLQG